MQTSFLASGATTTSSSTSTRANRPLVSKSAGVKWGALLAQSTTRAHTPPPSDHPQSTAANTTATTSKQHQQQPGHQRAGSLAAAATTASAAAAESLKQHLERQQRQAATSKENGDGDDGHDRPGFDELPAVPFLLLRVAPPEPPPALDLAAPPQELRDQLHALQAAASALFTAGAAGGRGGKGTEAGPPGEQRQQAETSGRCAAAAAAVAPLSFLRVPIAARYAVAAPVRGAPLRGGLLSGGSSDESDSLDGCHEDVAAALAGAGPRSASQAHNQQQPPAAQHAHHHRRHQAAGGGHAGRPAKSTVSMSTSVTGATDHGSLLTDAQSPDAQLVTRLRKLKLLQQQAAGLF